MICGYFLKEITDSNFAAIYSAVIFAASYYFLTYKHISEKPFKAADPAALFFFTTFHSLFLPPLPDQVK